MGRSTAVSSPFPAPSSSSSLVLLVFRFPLVRIWGAQILSIGFLARGCTLHLLSTALTNYASLSFRKSQPVVWSIFPQSSIVISKLFSANFRQLIYVCFRPPRLCFPLFATLPNNIIFCTAVLSSRCVIFHRNFNCCRGIKHSIGNTV